MDACWGKAYAGGHCPPVPWHSGLGPASEASFSCLGPGRGAGGDSTKDPLSLAAGPHGLAVHV